MRDVAPPALPYDGEVIGAVQRHRTTRPTDDIVVCAAGTLPGELHKLWRAARPGGYHVEYGYSCMGYEIAGGIGVKMARPEREVVVMVGDGSYLMLNSEIATSVMLGTKLVVVVLDNRGYGCIHRLQQACGGEGFNNLFDDCVQAPTGPPAIDFAAHARSLGALAEHVGSIARARGGARRARARRIGRTSSSSTPIRCGRPRRAAGGGKSACPRSPSRDEGARRARGYEQARRRRDRG